MTNIVDKSIKLYKELLTLPTISNATLLSNGTIISQFNQKDIELDITHKYLNTFYKQNDKYATTYPQELKDGTTFWLPSPSGKYISYIRKVDKSFYLDIWQGQHLKISATSTSFSKIYAEGTIGGFEWSSDEKSIAFIAEPTIITTNFFTVAKSADEKKVPTSTQYDFKDDWGEQYVGASNPSLFIYNLESNSFSKLVLPYSVIAFCWSNIDNIVVAGMDHHHRRLGMVFYNSRPADLYLVDFTKNYIHTNAFSTEVLTFTSESVRLTFGYSARYPRIIKDLLYFTSTDNVWYHTSCEKLCSIEWPVTNFNEILVCQTVEISKTPILSEKEFPGLWSCSILNKPLFLDNYFAITSAWRSKNLILLIDLRTKNGVKQFTFEDLELHSFSLLSIRENECVATVSSLNEPDFLIHFKVDQNTIDSSDLIEIKKVTLDSDFGWRLVYKSTESLSAQTLTSINNLSISVFDVPNLQEHAKYASIPVSSIEPSWNLELSPINKAFYSDSAPKNECSESFLLTSKKYEGKKMPLILYPHGGPHSAFRLGWSAFLVLCVEMGYPICMINYRGSSGYGQDFLSALPGHVGRKDIDDCISALICLMRNKDFNFDPNKVSIFGGSHGGFIAGHLIGQFPSIFKSCIVRNPVLNIPAELSSTDIPDWCYSVNDLWFPPIDQENIPKRDDLSKMFDSSPIRYVEHVKTPMMICVGTGDRRVPMAQSIEYYKILKSRKIDCKLLSYPDATHGLNDKVSIEADFAINSMLWISTYVPSSLDN